MADHGSLHRSDRAGYAIATSGSLAGGVLMGLVAVGALYLVWSLLSEEIRQDELAGIEVGLQIIGAGYVLGSIAGVWLWLSRTRHARAGRTALVLAALLAVLIGLIWFVYPLILGWKGSLDDLAGFRRYFAASFMSLGTFPLWAPPLARFIALRRVAGAWACCNGGEGRATPRGAAVTVNYINGLVVLVILVILLTQLL